MKRFRNFALGLVILIVLAGSTVTYRVRYNELVVLTTFGRADAASVKSGLAGDAGLHLRWPWPIQEVARTYDARVQVLDERLEEQQTLDKQNVVVSTFVAWRIADPLSFFRTLDTVAQAERQLADRLRDARAQIGRYTLAELASPDPAALKIDDAEQSMLERLREDAQAQGFGVEIEAVGIKRLLLAEAVTEKVFERMRSTRERLAQEARSEGEATASHSRAEAESAAARLLSFAERRAEGLRAEGAAAAAEYYETFREDEAFAIFLHKLDAARKTLGNNTTFVLDADQGPYDLFREPPGEAEGGEGGAEGGDGARDR